jgi:hypothetical protein
MGDSLSGEIQSKHQCFETRTFYVITALQTTAETGDTATSLGQSIPVKPSLKNYALKTHSALNFLLQQGKTGIRSTC